MGSIVALVRLARFTFNSGDGRVRCNVCGHVGRRLPVDAGWGTLRRAQCAGCGSHDRQRLFMLYLAGLDASELADANALHFAAEACLQDRLRERISGYVTADLTDPSADIRADLTSLPFESGRFDWVFAHHVLEHIVDDGAAFREIRRVLRPGGRAVLSVPVQHAWPQTWDDPAIDDAAKRQHFYGQHDHVRIYGCDFAERFASAGFEVSPLTASPYQCAKHGIGYDETLYIGTAV